MYFSINIETTAEVLNLEKIISHIQFTSEKLTMPRTKYFNYSVQKHSIESIINYLKEKGFSVSLTKRMAYIPEDLSGDWPDKGYVIDNYDITVEFPEDHPLDGFVGRIDCRMKNSMKFNEKENNKLFNDLKKRFSE